MIALRRFTTWCATRKALPPRPTLPESQIVESYLKGSGPGGQKINKTNSAVQLTHIPTGIVVKSQATRSRSQNRKIARSLLAEKVDLLLNGDQSRSAIVGAERKKKADSRAKKSRRKYRALDEHKHEQKDAHERQDEQDEQTMNEQGDERRNTSKQKQGNDQIPDKESADETQRPGRP